MIGRLFSVGPAELPSKLYGRGLNADPHPTTPVIETSQIALDLLSLLLWKGARGSMLWKGLRRQEWCGSYGPTLAVGSPRHLCCAMAEEKPRGGRAGPGDLEIVPPHRERPEGDGGGDP